jgi:hypothetical protein
MEDRNRYLESDGLYWESETHEWFHDKGNTSYAQEGNVKLPNIFCFVIRNKATGKYDRVVMDAQLHKIIYETKGLEELGVYLDKLKFLKNFGDDK